MYNQHNTNSITFSNLCEKYRNVEKERHCIGLLKEKTLHAVLKDYICEDKEYQEVKIGNFYADVFKDDTITEVQTRNLFALNKKLDFFLKSYKVNIIYPIISTKYIYWVSNETGLIEEPIKSPKHSSFVNALPQLDGIKEYIDNPNLKITLMLLETEEYRIKNGFGKNKKTRGEKADIFPICLVDTLEINSLEDVEKIIPANIPKEFTMDVFSKCTKLKGKDAFYAKRFLENSGFIKNIGKQGRKIKYSLGIQN